MTGYTPTTTFLNTGHGDLTIEWNEGTEAQRVEEIQRFMDQGVTFHKLEEQGKLRKKVVAVPITSASEGVSQKLLIKDPDIAKLVASNLGTIARFAGCENIKTVGAARTAEEAAQNDTIATNAKVGG